MCNRVDILKYLFLAQIPQICLTTVPIITDRVIQYKKNYEYKIILVMQITVQIKLSCFHQLIQKFQ